MLKLKDNVDLKELEKFGFEKHILKSTVQDFDENDTITTTVVEEIVYAKNTEYYVDYYDVKVRCGIVVDEGKREILRQGASNIHFGSELIYKYVQETLFDLIQAGLIEKRESK